MKIYDKYFEWLCSTIKYRRYGNIIRYRRLLELLGDIDFKYIMEQDRNRLADGLDLRDRFAYEHNIPKNVIYREMQFRDCSVLEMLVALSIRCEEQIMSNPEFGDRTGKWFWGMIFSLGFQRMTDEYYDETFIFSVVDIFMNRQYDMNGSNGNIFKINGKGDLRSVEIWYQMNWYLSELEE